jgi:hypothetical protein
MINICADGLIEVFSSNLTLSRDEIDQRIGAWVRTYTDDSAIGVMVLNTNYSVSYVESDVWDTAWRRKDGTPVSFDELDAIGHWSRYAVWAHDRGIDPFAIAMRHTREQGADVWFSVRMNDYHYLKYEPTSASLWRQHPEFRINDEATFDYSHPEVREYYKAYIVELCTRYDIKGIELDMLRGPLFFKDPITPEKTAILTDFLKEIRAAVDEVGRAKGTRFRISARTYPHPEAALAQGWDSVQWVADGSVDVLTLSNFFIPTSYEAPVGEWERLIAERGVERNRYAINVASDFCVFCVPWNDPDVRYIKSNTETLKGFAAYAFASGADGIYGFNLNHRDYVHHLDTGLDADFRQFSTRDAAEAGTRSHILTFDELLPAGGPAHLPIDLAAAQSVTLRLDTAGKPAVGGRYAVVIGTRDASARVSVAVNGVACAEGTPFSGPDHTEGLTNPPLVTELSEVARCVQRFELPDATVALDGVNEFVVTAREAARLMWFSVRVENPD